MNRAVEECVKEEEELQLEHFSNQEAWELGNILVELAEERGVKPALEITVNGYVVFRYAFDGTNLHNSMWLRRKSNTVNTVHMSSLHAGALLETQQEDIEKDWYLPAKDYAVLGGGFPLRLKGTGVIGSVCCSGLPHEEDHRMVTDALRRFLEQKKEKAQEKCYRSELVGLFGDPVDENPTVVTIEAGFRALGLNYHYNTMRVKPEDLEIAVKSLKALGYKGTHITIPHKVAVLPYLDHVAEDARLMGAVNTIYVKDGETYGENTDGKGFLLSLTQGGVALKGKKVTILGAGGAARAISVELANAGVSLIEIVNIEAEMGEELVRLLNEKTNTKARFILWDHTYAVPKDTDILVQATSVGLYPDQNCPNIEYDSLRPELIVCDVVPNPPVTEFVRRARQKGCRTFVGLDMLVAQGAISFKLWTGCDAPVEIMKAALSKEFAE